MCASNDLEFVVHNTFLQVGVKSLKVVGSQGWALMREGEAEKQVVFGFYNCLLLSILLYLEENINYEVSIKYNILFHAEAILCISVDFSSA